MDDLLADFIAETREMLGGWGGEKMCKVGGRL